MLDGVLKLGQFITEKFGLPGAMAVGLAVWMAYQLQGERASHDKTREQVNTANDKRVELLTTYLKTLQEFKLTLDAVIAMLGKR